MNTAEMKPTGLMFFNHKPHLTYTLLDTQYLSMRPLVDQIGLDWRRQKSQLLDDDAVLFYGTLLLDDGNVLQPACKYSLKNGISASHDSEVKQKTAHFENEKGQKNAVSASNCSLEPQKIATFCSEDAQKDTLFIRLRRVQMYIARISIGHVRGTGGNHSSAEYLLALHEEWAEALHEYETNGIAIKAGHIKLESTKVRDFLAMCKEKRTTSDLQDRQVLQSLMKEAAEKMGHPYQSDLIDDAGNQ
jgi:hypothetical protein